MLCRKTLNTFTGNGTVWLAPTQVMYEKLSFGAMPTNDNMNNKVSKQK
ncbi:hypothetical protein ACTPEM_24620 [Clostridioides difficile]